jgi:hypothetical protein
MHRPSRGSRKCPLDGNFHVVPQWCPEGERPSTWAQMVASSEPRQAGNSELQFLSAKWRYNLLSRLLHYFSQGATTNYHKLVELKNTNVYFHSSGGFLLEL